MVNRKVFALVACTFITGLFSGCSHRYQYTVKVLSDTNDVPIKSGTFYIKTSKDGQLNSTILTTRLNKLFTVLLMDKGFKHTKNPKQATFIINVKYKRSKPERVTETYSTPSYGTYNNQTYLIGSNVDSYTYTLFDYSIEIKANVHEKEAWFMSLTCTTKDEESIDVFTHMIAASYPFLFKQRLKPHSILMFYFNNDNDAIKLLTNKGLIKKSTPLSFMDKFNYYMTTKFVEMRNTTALSNVRE